MSDEKDGMGMIPYMMFPLTCSDRVNTLKRMSMSVPAVMYGIQVKYQVSGGIQVMQTNLIEPGEKWKGGEVEGQTTLYG